MNPRHIGIDFDNTIVCYKPVFEKIIQKQPLIPKQLPPNKTALRNYLRSVGKEEEWTRLQGYIYGEGMILAEPFPGLGSFFHACQMKNIQISIISHRTKTPYLGAPVDLHAAARQWLAGQSFFTPKVHAYFECTLREKLERIAASGCDLFVDDLPELLQEKDFPSHVQKTLFDPENQSPNTQEWISLPSWTQALSILLS